jgi:hypothetical protein
MMQLKMTRTTSTKPQILKLEYLCIQTIIQLL